MGEIVHRSTDRALDILELLARHTDGLSFIQIAKCLEVPKGSLHPILQALLRRNYICINKQNLYRIGAQAYYVGSQYVREGTSLHLIEERMKEAADTLKMTIFFGILDGDGQVFYLLKSSYPSTIQITAVPGYKFPAYSTAIGKALICRMDEQALRALYPGGLIKVTEHTIDDWGQLLSQLCQVRENGIAFEKEESTPFVQCFAVPIINDKDVVAAVSAAIPVFLYSDDLGERVRERLLSLQAEIESIVALNVQEWKH